MYSLCFLVLEVCQRLSRCLIYATVPHRKDPDVCAAAADNSETLLLWCVRQRAKILHPTNDRLKLVERLTYGRAVKLQVLKRRSNEDWKMCRHAFYV